MICRPHSYPRQYRLRKKAQFASCRENGKHFHSAHFVVFICPHDEDYPITGFAVSRKVGNAVMRNRIKRLLREFFRLKRAFLPTANILVIPKRGINPAEFCLDDVERELLPLMRHLARPGQTP